VHGTPYLFQVTLAVLSLLSDTLLQMDMSEINNVFKSFRDDELAGKEGSQACNYLPPDDLIISESYKFVIN
jgi:hypothetical protein